MAYVALDDTAVSYADTAPPCSSACVRRQALLRFAVTMRGGRVRAPCTMHGRPLRWTDCDAL